MNDDLRSCDSILAWLKTQEENRIPISPHLYMEAITSLNILKGDEDDKLINLESECARFRADEVLAGKSVAGAKIAVEASPIFNETRKQRAKIERIVEAIRIGKLSARLKSDTMRSGL